MRAAFADVVFRHEAMRHEDWGELHALTALATCEIPVLAIAGEHDLGTPPAAARRIAATAPRGELVIIDGVGHFPFAVRAEAAVGGAGGRGDDDHDHDVASRAAQTPRRSASSSGGTQARTIGAYV